MEEFNMLNRTIKRGQIFFARIPVTCGSVYHGLRPVLIISNNRNNRFSNVLTCIPITTAQTKSNLPTHVHIEESVLKKPSTLMCENISNYSVEILENLVAEIPEDSEVMKQVERAVLIQIGVI